VKGLVSVVLPVFDGARFLSEAVESVLAQDHRPWELVVVDDGSRDGSAELAAAWEARVPEIRLLRLPENRGPAAARNAGLALARGELITFLDADDCMLPGRLAFQAGFLTRHGRVDLMLNAQEVAVEPGAPAPRWLEPSRPASEEPSFYLMSMIVRRQVLARVGGFDPSFAVSSDTEWFTRALAAGVRIAKVPRPVVRRRVHGSNLTYRHEEMRRATFRSLRARIHERRSAT
jgi:glycosyltransferase involved in cell wall biosynthesis